MKNFRFLLIFGMILVSLCGIMPVSGYEERFSLSAFKGESSKLHSC